MIKKLFIPAILALSMVWLVNCETASTRCQLATDCVDYKTEGWLNDDTFQVRTLGAPNKKATGFVRRRTQAEEAALLSAQKRVIELMLGADVQGACGSESGESTGCAITKEFSGKIKGGAIVKKSFDKEGNCEITYRIHRNGLKSEAETAVSKING